MYNTLHKVYVWHCAHTKILTPVTAHIIQTYRQRQSSCLTLEIARKNISVKLFCIFSLESNKGIQMPTKALSHIWRVFRPLKAFSFKNQNLEFSTNFAPSDFDISISDICGIRKLRVSFENFSGDPIYNFQLSRNVKKSPHWGELVIFATHTRIY